MIGFKKKVGQIKVKVGLIERSRKPGSTSTDLPTMMKIGR